MADARHTFPFSAIVGQERMKLALCLNAVHPGVGGVLIRGERGTGKSTAVRALARLLPEQDVVVGCHFGCDPDELEHLCIDCRDRLGSGENPLPRTRRRMRVVELPINASEDRVVGTIDLEAALKEGTRRFEPGVLAEANRNILYVDEVNLLDDHIVDVLLDAAAIGVNVVEREGVSVVHPARFILVGTRNPEEGELRPQLLVRFGLCADVEGIREPALRVEIVERERAYRERDAAFAAEFRDADTAITAALLRARQALPGVVTTPAQARLISRICVEAGVAGHRADLVVERTARALAAFREHRSPTRDDIFDAAELALAHRSRNPIRREKGDSNEGERREEEATGDESEARGSSEQQSASGSEQQGSVEERASQTEAGQDSTGTVEGTSAGGGQGSESSPDVGDVFDVRKIELPRQRRPRKQGGKRATAEAADRRGRYVHSRTGEKITDPAVDATIPAAAPHQVPLARRRLERLSVGGTTPLTHGLLAGLKVIKTETLRDATVRPLLVLISDGRGNISMFKEEPLVEAQKVAAMIQAEKIDTLVIDSARDFSHLPSIQHLARVAPMYQTYAINACADLAQRMGARYYGLFDLSRDEIASAVERQLNRG